MFMAKEARKPAAAVRRPAAPARKNSPAAAARPVSSARAVQQRLGNAGTQALAAGMVARSAAPEPASAGSAAPGQLSISHPGDAAEREAERVAAAIMRMPEPGSPPSGNASPVRSTSPPVVQRRCAHCEEDGKKPRVLRKESSSAAPEMGASVPEGIRALADGGIPLAPATRAFFEPRFGADLGDVRIHTDASAARTARSIDAEAFTVGQDIAFGAGRFSPDSTAGRHLLAHELTHTIQQGGGRLAAQDAAAAGRNPDTLVSRTEAPQVQRLPSAGEILDSIEETVSDAADSAAGVASDVAGAVEDAVDTVGEGLSEAADAVGDAAVVVADTATDAANAIVDAGEEALDWLATEAGQIAQSWADALGVSVTITDRGLEIIVPSVCPIDAITEGFDLPGLDAELMAPIGAIPIGAALLVGEAGVAAHLAPRVEVQLGPICLNGMRILIDPFGGNYSVSGSVSATAAASLAAEVRGGIRGAVSLEGVIPIGGVPVPIVVPLAAVEGGVAGLVRAIGAGTLTIGGSLGTDAGGGASLGSEERIDFLLGGDLFVGAYAQLELLGQTVCRIYWQPYEWHGDIDGSIGVSLGITVTPGDTPSADPVITPPAMDALPVAQIPLALSREGFSDDCPVIDRICEVLEALGLLPSQNGAEWEVDGPYGPGPRLPGPLEVYEKAPAGRASGAECRGACGVDCDPCESEPKRRSVDPVTGDIWEYTGFEDCNSHEACRQHDAAFDWAAAEKGETGDWAIILPWHMAANIECACDNLAGNCIAWIAGLPPYDGKLYFAESSVLVGGGGQLLDGESCHESHPNAPDCIESQPDRDSILEAWGLRHRIEAFRDCTVVADFSEGSMIDCNGGPGVYWNCTATDVVTGEDLVVGIHECICCNDDDTRGSTWGEPHIVFDPLTMSDELVLELCDRGLIVRVICIPYEERMIGRFGNARRDLDIDPDTARRSRVRPEDAPVLESFKRIYNRLESWTIFIRTNHPELSDEFDSEFEVDEQRKTWLEQIKTTGDDYKREFRDITDADPEEMRRRYREVLATIERDVNALVHRIAAWYKTRMQDPRSIEEIIEDVHRQGTELWRAAWRRAILQVNRVLARLWPPAKRETEAWVAQLRLRYPGQDLEGSISELDYIGSLASGFKSPPKQNIRFNPEKFDVDGFIVAPPLAKYAKFIMVPPAKPRHGNIFVLGTPTDIVPLITFARAVETELDARVEGYAASSDDPFDVAIKTEDLPEQQRGSAATERLYGLRETLPTAKYQRLVEELRAAGLLDASGTRLPEDLTTEQADSANTIMDRYGPRPSASRRRR
jgi:hypothetical protein